MSRRRSRTVLAWATCVALTIGGYQLALAQGRSPVNVLFILLLVGVLAAAWAIGRSVGALTILALGVLLAWPLPIGWVLALLPPDLARAGHDFGWIGGLTVLIVALVMAISWRPTTRGPDRVGVLESRLVNVIALSLAVGGPLIGWVVYSAFTRPDIYMRPVAIGLLVGLYGLLLFSGYSAIHTVIGRARPAALLAAAYPLLLLVAVQGPRWDVRQAPAPVVVVEATSADGRLLRASGASATQAPANAVDGRVDTAWNAERTAPAWIEIDLGQPSTITEIGLLVEQSPDGETIHVVTGVDALGHEITLAEFRGLTRDDQWLRRSLTPPAAGVQSIRVTTVASPSWVAWSEIEVAVAP